MGWQGKDEGEEWRVDGADGVMAMGSARVDEQVLGFQ